MHWNKDVTPPLPAVFAVLYSKEQEGIGCMGSRLGRLRAMTLAGCYSGASRCWAQQCLVGQVPQAIAQSRPALTPGPSGCCSGCCTWGAPAHWASTSFFKLPYYCCIGYIVTFTKVLTMYHSLIHPLQYYPLSPLPIPVTVKRSHFSIFIH
jgi:hypothetical protein